MAALRAAATGSQSRWLLSNTQKMRLIEAPEMYSSRCRHLWAFRDQEPTDSLPYSNVAQGFGFFPVYGNIGCSFSNAKNGTAEGGN